LEKTFELMNEEKSIIDFLTADEFQQCADEMIEGVKSEAEQINRPVYFGDGTFCYEQWPNGKKYVLMTDKISVVRQ
jgi:hypothetical protein